MQRRCWPAGPKDGTSNNLFIRYRSTDGLLVPLWGSAHLPVMRRRLRLETSPRQERNNVLPHDRRAHRRAVRPDNGEDACAGRGEVVDGSGGGGIRRGGRRRGRVRYVGDRVGVIGTDG